MSGVSSRIQRYFLLGNPFVRDVFIVGHEFVDMAVGGQFDYARGDGLGEGVVM